MEQRGTTIIPREEIQRKHQEAQARERGEQLARDYACLPARLEALDLALRLADSDAERAEISEIKAALKEQS